MTTIFTQNCVTIYLQEIRLRVWNRLWFLDKHLQIVKDNSSKLYYIKRKRFPDQIRNPKFMFWVFFIFLIIL